jgi:RNA polymerase sigma factor (sigma-70 family)
MLVEMRPIETIRSYENNPRRNDAGVDAVAASIQTYGFRQPIIQACQERAQGHLHLVRLLAREAYRRCGRTVPLEELLGEAGFALSDAAGRYDAARNVPFGAYATMVIRHRLVRAVTAWRRGGRLDLVRFTDLADTPSGSDLRDFDPPCPRAREPYQEAAARELLDHVRRVLPARWFRLLRLHYVCGHTLEEAGELLGVSRQRVQQLLVQALVRARRHRLG